MTHPNFKKKVQEDWSIEISSNSMHVIWGKLMVVKVETNDLNNYLASYQQKARGFKTLIRSGASRYCYEPL